MATKATLTKATKARERKLAADEAYRQAIIDALADGHSMRAVAQALGIALGRVHQIAHGTR